MKAKFNEWMKELDISDMTMGDAPRCILTFAKKENDDGTMSEDYYLSMIDKYEYCDGKILNTFMMVNKYGRICGCNSYYFDKEQPVRCCDDEKYVEADGDCVPKIKTAIEITYDA